MSIDLMPVDLTNLSALNNIVDTYTPKFFDKNLTGNGKTIGLLQEKRNPIHVRDTNTMVYDINITYSDMKKHSITTNATHTAYIPLYVLNASTIRNIHHRNNLPSDIKKWDYIKTNSLGLDTFVKMTPHSLTMQETTQNNGPKTKNLNVCYHIQICMLPPNPQPPGHERNHYMAYDMRTSLVWNYEPTTHGTNYPVYWSIFTKTPLTALQLFSDNVHTLDMLAVHDFIANYNLYDAICEQSKLWQTDKIINELTLLFETNTNQYSIRNVLQYLETYTIPLDIYRKIYDTMTAMIQKQADINYLCKYNLNLLLLDTLNSLDKNKMSISGIPAPAKPVTIDPKFSKEQVKAITATDPLVLIQAGAGTGKSTVILNRIKYMTDCGIKPEDILVCSFTNAAADHIMECNKNVKAMTIANMIHQIYITNFPNHTLSNLDTIINSLDIYFPKHNIAHAFRDHLKRIKKDNNTGITATNDFIEENYNSVIEILDTIKQTSLELEIMICYQQIENLIEPSSVINEYVIIDEVQDTSVFEFIFMLKYIEKHKKSLFIVGDCSQTLYEFRAANPTALNMLEASNIFSTYSLQINYRSNQEILDFANNLLQNIQANQFAHIQLQANNLTPVTSQSFQKKVNIHYEHVRSQRALNDVLGGLFATTLRKYIDEKRKNKEQIAFLAYSRAHVTQMQTILQNMYPTAKCINITSARTYSITIFSNFIKRYSSIVKFIPSQSIINVISRKIIDNLDMLIYRQSDAAVKKAYAHIAGWSAKYRPVIQGYEQKFIQNMITEDEFYKAIFDTMLEYEIEANSLKDKIARINNNIAKTEENTKDADFIVSTIHGAKGLEFDNTVILYNANKDTTTDEELKRLYYVALTRAKNSEFILAYGTTVHSHISTQYNLIVNALKNKEQKTNP